VPDLTVGLGYTRSRALLSGDNPQALALTVSVPLPLFSRNQGEIQKARVETRRAEDAARALEAGVGREVAAAHARYAAAAEKVARYDGGALARAERALAVAEKTYRSGDRSLLEFLEAERTFIAVRSDYLDTMYELRAARLELEQAVGADLTEAA
jgi:cobalt-zinc-cadmium efflux system outer membrane protein